MLSKASSLGLVSKVGRVFILGIISVGTLIVFFII